LEVVAGTPEGAQFEDYVIFLLEGEVGKFEIDSTNEEVNAQIIMYLSSMNRIRIGLDGWRSRMQTLGR